MSAEQKRAKSIKVLLVDDDKICQYLTSKYLDDLGCDVDIAESGLKAKGLLKKKYDIIFLDIGLPDKDGITLTYEIRNELKLTMPIIAVTGHALESNEKQCLKAGMNDVLEKPTTKQKLKEMIDLYVP